MGSVLGRQLGPERDYAESWEICDHGDDQSLVAGGPWAGTTLGQLVAERNGDLFGRHAGLEQFPLLFKFIDACDRLSVQVHPDDEQAAEFAPGERGKTEAWVVIDAGPDSVLYAGLKAGVDRAALELGLREGDVERLLHRFSVRAGDCIFIPAGTVHAIGAGVLLAEIQQSSDLTYRLFDWNRTDPDGKPRPLHVSEALAVIDFQRGPIRPIRTPRPDTPGVKAENLVRCDYFVLDRYRGDGRFPLGGDERFHIVSVLEAAAELHFDEPVWPDSAGGKVFSLSRGDTVLLPASVPAVTARTTDAGAVLLDAYLP